MVTDCNMVQYSVSYCQTVRLSLYLTLSCPSVSPICIYLSVCLFVRVCQSYNLCAYFYMCFCLFALMSAVLFVCVSVCASACACFCFSFCLSVPRFSLFLPYLLSVCAAVY